VSLAIDISDAQFERARRELYLLPIGSGMLTPDAALAWLENDHHLYGSVAMRGLRSGEKRDRGAAEMLLLDLARMAEACGRALAKGKPVRLERTSVCVDLEEGTRGLGRIVALVEAEYADAVDGEIRQVLFGALAGELAARVDILLRASAVSRRGGRRTAR
jgi:hypothetical protein